MQHEERSPRVLVEVDLETLERLLARRAISIEEFRSVDAHGRHRLRDLFLSLLSRRLVVGP